MRMMTDEHNNEASTDDENEKTAEILEAGEDSCEGAVKSCTAYSTTGAGEWESDNDSAQSAESTCCWA